MMDRLLLIRTSNVVRFRWFSLALLFYFFNPIVYSADVIAFNPQPFRNSELQGRTFNIEEYSFLHRYSYLPDPWRTIHVDDKLLMTVGSVTSKEFYSLYYWNKTMSATDNLSIILKGERGEDFDNRYERTLFGLSYQWNQFTLSGFSSLIADKSQEDAQLEMGWQIHETGYIRYAIVAADFVANAKQEIFYYERAPYTHYIEVKLQPIKRSLVRGYINYNSPLTRIDNISNEQFEYENISGQWDWFFQSKERAKYYISYSFEQGTRERFLAAQYFNLERNFSSLILRADFTLNEFYDYWYGLRIFALEEEDIGFVDMESSNFIERNELTVFGGIKWQLGSNLTFSPNLFLTQLDNHSKTINDGLSSKWDNNLLIKLSLPLEWKLQNNISITLNTTYEVDQNNFGGLNLQMYMPL